MQKPTSYKDMPSRSMQPTHTVNCRLCAELLGVTSKADSVTEENLMQWLFEYHIKICVTYLLHTVCKPTCKCKSTSGLLSYGLYYQDMEWFTRGIIVRAVLQVCNFSDIPCVALLGCR